MRIDHDEAYKAKCLRALSGELRAAIEYGYILAAELGAGSITTQEAQEKADRYVNATIKELSK